MTCIGFPLLPQLIFTIIVFKCCPECVIFPLRMFVKITKNYILTSKFISK